MLITSGWGKQYAKMGHFSILVHTCSGLLSMGRMCGLTTLQNYEFISAKRTIYSVFCGDPVILANVGDTGI